MERPSSGMPRWALLGLELQSLGSTHEQGQTASCDEFCMVWEWDVL